MRHGDLVMKEEKHFINLLRVLAAICITNSHLANVWPISAIASGGMLGDVLFFAISGYCLYNSEFRLRDFGKWYIKRIRRIYITVTVITLLTCFFTEFPSSVSGWIKTFIYPTQYHFVASIMILYIVYYIWMYFLKRWRVRVWISGTTFLTVTLIIYALTFDKSWYHIDVVEDQFIRFLFFTAMLMGAYFRESEKEVGNPSVKNVGAVSILCVGLVMLYFAVRIVVPKFELFTVQFLTWIAILIALYGIFYWAETLEPYLLQLPVKANRCLAFLAGITLQIYLVQFPIIERFEIFIFPLNLLVIMVVIIVAATIVYWIDYFVQKIIDVIVYHNHCDGK